MSTATRDRREDDGVEFTYEDDLVTARDTETGVAGSGNTRSEALAMLADALALHEGEGEPITDEDAFFDKLAIDSTEFDETEKPPWLD